jgi:T5orf172 domain
MGGMMLEYESRQMGLPFAGGFRLMPPVTNRRMCDELVVTERVPGWLEAHSPQHVHGETHVHYDSCTWTTPGEYTPAEDGPGYVYFIENTHDSLIKIGKSRDPEKRLRSLQTGSGFALKLIARKFVPKMLEAEQRLHELFEKDQLEGEWFLPSSKLLKYIGAL